MSQSTPGDLPVAGSAGVSCRHLRHKGMYVYTDGQDHPHDDDSTIYWCLKSMKNYGPDDELVDRESCCESGRSCYEPL